MSRQRLPTVPPKPPCDHQPPPGRRPSLQGPGRGLGAGLRPLAGASLSRACSSPSGAQPGQGDKGQRAPSVPLRRPPYLGAGRTGPLSYKAAVLACPWGSMRQDVPKSGRPTSQPCAFLGSGPLEVFVGTLGSMTAGGSSGRPAAPRGWGWSPPLPSHLRPHCSHPPSPATGGGPVRQPTTPRTH